MSNKNKRDYVYCRICNCKMKMRMDIRNNPYVTRYDSSGKDKIYCKLCYDHQFGEAYKAQTELESELRKRFENLNTFLFNCARYEILEKIEKLVLDEGIDLSDTNNFYKR